LIPDRRCYLSSPVLGGGFRINLMDGALLSARDEQGSSQAVEAAFSRLQESGHPWAGEEATTDELRHVALLHRYQRFEDDLLPLLVRLQILGDS
jgi:hypothetical protein